MQRPRIRTEEQQIGFFSSPLIKEAVENQKGKNQNKRRISKDFGDWKSEGMCWHMEWADFNIQHSIRMHNLPSPRGRETIIHPPGFWQKPCFKCVPTFSKTRGQWALKATNTDPQPEEASPR